MWWIIGGAGAFIALIVYSAVVVGARADREIETWMGKDREG